jgi:hypothetical protein
MTVLDDPTLLIDVLCCGYFRGLVHGAGSGGWFRGLDGLKLIPAIKEMLPVNGTCDVNGTSLLQSTLHVHCN